MAKIKNQKNQVRIIAGQYKGRKLNVPNIPGLRPTGDRIRETLFNWLMPYIKGSVCLDLFTGSGALALEAASRGAAHVVAIDISPKIIHDLKLQTQTWTSGLGISNLEFLCEDALVWLQKNLKSGQKFDVVFIDPPFSESLWPPVLEYLDSYLKPETFVYIEKNEELLISDNFLLEKSLRAGKVEAHLYRYMV
ncbi:MAG: 16S rRNA (guanine(966)-N(2))-methyltransferase RsmD [Gammaproteobacteria bacterium]